MTSIVEVDQMIAKAKRLYKTKSDQGLETKARICCRMYIGANFDINELTPLDISINRISNIVLKPQKIHSCIRILEFLKFRETMQNGSVIELVVICGAAKELEKICFDVLLQDPESLAYAKYALSQDIKIIGSIEQVILYGKFLENTTAIDQIKFKGLICCLASGFTDPEALSIFTVSTTDPLATALKPQKMHSALSIQLLLTFENKRPVESFITAIILSGASAAFLKISKDVLTQDEQCLTIVNYLLTTPDNFILYDMHNNGTI